MSSRGECSHTWCFLAGEEDTSPTHGTPRRHTGGCCETSAHQRCSCWTSNASSILQNLEPVPRRAPSQPPSSVLIPALCLPFLTCGSLSAGKRCPIAVLLVTHLKPNHCFSSHPFIHLSFSCSNGVTRIITKLCKSLPVCCRSEMKSPL